MVRNSLKSTSSHRRTIHYIDSPCDMKQKSRERKKKTMGVAQSYIRLLEAPSAVSLIPSLPIAVKLVSGSSSVLPSRASLHPAALPSSPPHVSAARPSSSSHPTARPPPTTRTPRSSPAARASSGPTSPYATRCSGSLLWSARHRCGCSSGS
jgi:hypothetical protein